MRPATSAGLQSGSVAPQRPLPVGIDGAGRNDGVQAPFRCCASATDQRLSIAGEQGRSRILPCRPQPRFAGDADLRHRRLHHRRDGLVDLLLGALLRRSQVDATGGPTDRRDAAVAELGDGSGHFRCWARCLFISNMVTLSLPNTLRSLSSARISRRFSGFCRLLALMYSHTLLTTSPRGSGPAPTTALSSSDGFRGFCSAFGLPPSAFAAGFFGFSAVLVAMWPPGLVVADSRRHSRTERCACRNPISQRPDCEEIP